MEPPSAEEPRSLTFLRLTLAAHVVGWWVVALPPLLHGSIISTGAAVLASVAVLVIPLDAVPAVAVLPARVHQAVSAIAALAVVVGFVMGWPGTVQLVAAAAVLLSGVHALAWSGLRIDGEPISAVAQRPRIDDPRWVQVMRGAVIADLGLVVGGVGTGVATLGGGLVTAGIAVAGWCVAAGALAWSAIEAGRTAPGLVGGAEPL